MAIKFLFISVLSFLFVFSSCKEKREEKKNPLEKTSGQEHFSKTTLIDTTLRNKKFIFQKSFYGTGDIRQTGFYSKDTIMQGMWTNYYPDGNIESITNYNDGLKDGYFKSYHDNGQLWTEIMYSNNKVMEVIANYDRNGNPKHKGTLKNGNGTLILYDNKGEKKSIEQYKDGKLIDY